MRIVPTVLLALMFAAVSQAGVADERLHVYLGGGKGVRSYPVEEIAGIDHPTDRSGRVSDMRITFADGSELKEPLAGILDCRIGEDLPRLYIVTDGVTPDVTSKTEYVSGTVALEGCGRYEDLQELKVDVRGRGNSTWNCPKRPYRLKFDSKVSLCGLEKAKSYVLLANYMDLTLMRNAVAMELARLLRLPFCNSMVPVEVWFNGNYKGSYCLTEKIGINGASVDIDDSTGVLLELDKYFDEDYQFRSPVFGLPVMVKDPDPEEWAEENGSTADAFMQRWSEDFARLEKSSRYGSGTALGETLDIEEAARYVLLYALTGNRDINHPGSIYMYKRGDDDLWHFGPPWDFDWGFNYNSSTGKDNYSPRMPLLTGYSSDKPGYTFFTALASYPGFSHHYRRALEDLTANGLDDFWEFFDSYAGRIRPGVAANAVLWPAAGESDPMVEFDAAVGRLRDWLKARIEFISSDRGDGLFDFD